MGQIIGIILGALKITLLDIVLSGDNVGVIALATKDLPEKYAKKASIIGISFAISLRIIFAIFITYILMISWLPIKLIGGLLLVKITWDLIKDVSDEEIGNFKSTSELWSAVLNIVLADLSMSLDNVLAIGSAADGNVLLIVIGLAVNIPILFLGSRFVSNLMKKHPLVIYIGGTILAHTAFKMILEDHLIAPFIPSAAGIIIPYLMAVLVFIYGIYAVRKYTKAHSQS